MIDYKRWARKVDQITAATSHPVAPLGGFEYLCLLGALRAAQNRSGALLADIHRLYSSNVERIAWLVTPLAGEDEADTLGRTFTALFDLWPDAGEHPLFCLKMPFTEAGGVRR